jgi:hypothetical protein
MIKLDLNKSTIKPEEIQELEQRVNDIHNMLLNKEGEGAEFTD